MFQKPLFIILFHICVHIYVCLCVNMYHFATHTQNQAYDAKIDGWYNLSMSVQKIKSLPHVNFRNNNDHLLSTSFWF